MLKALDKTIHEEIHVTNRIIVRIDDLFLGVIGDDAIGGEWQNDLMRLRYVQVVIPVTANRVEDIDITRSGLLHQRIQRRQQLLVVPRIEDKNRFAGIGEENGVRFMYKRYVRSPIILITEPRTTKTTFLQRSYEGRVGT